MPSKKEIALQKSIARKRARWEAAWEEFIEAEEDYRDYWDSGAPPGHRKRVVGARLRKAKERLRKLDSEFCRRMGI